MWKFHTTNIYMYTACGYNFSPMLVNFVQVTTLHLGVPFMGRQQIKAPWTFHMTLAYLCDLSSLLCNTVCLPVNLLCATYSILSSMVFYSTVKLSKYVSSWIFALFLSHLEKYNYNRHNTTAYDNIAYNCSRNVPTNVNHSKTGGGGAI